MALVSEDQSTSYANVTLSGVSGDWQQLSGELVSSTTGEGGSLPCGLCPHPSLVCLAGSSGGLGRYISLLCSGARCPPQAAPNQSACCLSRVAPTALSLSLSRPADSNARLAVLFKGGDLILDSVSLFPTGGWASVCVQLTVYVLGGPGGPSS